MLYKCAKVFILTKLWLSFFFYSSIVVRHNIPPCMKNEQHFLTHEKKLDYHDMPSLFWCKTYFVCIYVSKFACIVIFDVINKAFVEKWWQQQASIWSWKMIISAIYYSFYYEDDLMYVLSMCSMLWIVKGYASFKSKQDDGDHRPHLKLRI